MIEYFLLGLVIGAVVGIAILFGVLVSSADGLGMQEDEREFIADESLRDGFDWRR